MFYTTEVLHCIGSSWLWCIKPKMWLTSLCFWYLFVHKVVNLNYFILTYMYIDRDPLPTFFGTNSSANTDNWSFFLPEAHRDSQNCWTTKEVTYLQRISFIWKTTLNMVLHSSPVFNQFEQSCSWFLTDEWNALLSFSKLSITCNLLNIVYDKW